MSGLPVIRKFDKWNIFFNEKTSMFGYIIVFSLEFGLEFIMLIIPIQT